MKHKKPVHPASHLVPLDHVSLDIRTVLPSFSPENIASLKASVAAMEESNPVYLALPPLIASLATDPLYLAALPHGRVFYRESMHDSDTSSGLERVPLSYTRAEVLEIVNADICPSDRLLAVLLPLSWRVGFSVGWLSGLSISQPDDAQAALVVLAALVAPLASASVGQHASSSRAKRSSHRTRR